MDSSCDTLGPETETFCPAKDRRADRRESRARDSGREIRKVEGIEALEAQEPELPLPSTVLWDSYSDPRDREHEILQERAAQLVGKQDVESEDGLFARFYSDMLPMRRKDAARRFIHKAAKHPVAAGTVLAFGGHAWLVLEALQDAQGKESWRLVYLDVTYDVDEARTRNATDADLFGIEACPDAVACLDLASVVHQDFVAGCRAFVRIGRVPPTLLKKLRQSDRSSSFASLFDVHAADAAGILWRASMIWKSQ